MKGVDVSRASFGAPLAALSGCARRFGFVTALSAAAIVVAGWGASASGKSGSVSSPSGSATIGVVAPFSGPLAVVGPVFLYPCQVAAHVVNQAGGIQGTTVNCTSIDDTGDLADAVPNVTRALATVHPVLAVGVDTATEAVTVPLFTHSKIPAFAQGGLTAYDTSTDPFFWRTNTSDGEQGAAFALWAVEHGYKRVAAVFPNTPDSQAVVPGLLTALRSLHAQFINIAPPADSPSYASVVERLLSFHPQALLTDSDVQTQATLLAQYSQLNHGKLPRLIIGQDILEPSYLPTMTKALGKDVVLHNMQFIGRPITGNAVATRAFTDGVKATLSAKQAAVVYGIPGDSLLYDNVILACLAMEAAKSTVGAVYNQYVERVSTKVPGAVAVNTFAEGARALKSGHRIDYVGTQGQLTWTKYHNAPTGYFGGYQLNSKGAAYSVGVMPVAKVIRLLGIG